MIRYAPDPPHLAANSAPRYIQIDCGKCFREQVLRWYTRHSIPRMDALILTHEHADAILGLDDIRGLQPFPMPGGPPVYPLPVYVTQHTMDSVIEKFGYLVSKEQQSQLGTRRMPSTCPPVPAPGISAAEAPLSGTATNGSAEAPCAAAAVTNPPPSATSSIVAVPCGCGDADTGGREREGSTARLAGSGQPAPPVSGVGNTSQEISPDGQSLSCPVSRRVAPSSVPSSGQHKDPLPVLGTHAEVPKVPSVDRDASDASTSQGGKPTVYRRVTQLDWRLVSPLVEAPFVVEGLQFTPLPVLHGEDYISLGFEFGHTDRVIYLSDVSRIPESTMTYLEGRRLSCGRPHLVVIDALNKTKPHETHFYLPETLGAIRALRPERALLVGMTHQFDHEEVNAELRLWSVREGIQAELSRDGLCVPLRL